MGTINGDVRFICLQETRVTQQYSQHVVAHPWQSCQYLLPCRQRHIAQQFTENAL